jgi:heme-degrading monooxygenase HmoA
MFAAIFEILPKRERFEDYLTLAKQLRPLLQKMDGFVDNERFGSQTRRGWILSVSTWRDEKSVIRWRTTGEHHRIQQKGRFEIFQDYHLRVGDVTADSDAPKEAPVKEQRFDATEVGTAKLLTLTELIQEQEKPIAAPGDLLSMLGLSLANSGVVERDVFVSIYTPGKSAVLVAWKDAMAADGWTPVKIPNVQKLRHRKIRVIRDYGMFDRREAPQFFPDTEGRETRHSRPLESTQST